MMEWLRDKLMWPRLRAMRYFLSRKEQESVVFVKEEFLHKKIQKKKMFFNIFDHKFTDTEQRSVTQYGLWGLVKAIRGLKSLLIIP